MNELGQIENFKLKRTYKRITISDFLWSISNRFIFLFFRVYVSNKILLVFEFDIGAVAGMNPKTFFSLLTISSSSFYAAANKL